MSDKELPDDLQRWTAKRRAALVLSIPRRLRESAGSDEDSA